MSDVCRHCGAVFVHKDTEYLPSDPENHVNTIEAESLREQRRFELVMAAMPGLFVGMTGDGMLSTPASIANHRGRLAVMTADVILDLLETERE